MEKTNTAQFWLGVVITIAGISLLFLGTFMPPSGEIHPTLLVAFGEVATFAGALVGVDYHYKYRIRSLEEETQRLNKSSNSTNES